MPAVLEAHRIDPHHLVDVSAANGKRNARTKRSRRPERPVVGFDAFPMLQRSMQFDPVPVSCEFPEHPLPVAGAPGYQSLIPNGPRSAGA